MLLKKQILTFFSIIFKYLFYMYVKRRLWICTDIILIWFKTSVEAAILLYWSLYSLRRMCPKWHYAQSARTHPVNHKCNIFITYLIVSQNINIPLYPAIPVWEDENSHH